MLCGSHTQPCPSSYREFGVYVVLGTLRSMPDFLHSDYVVSYSP